MWHQCHRDFVLYNACLPNVLSFRYIICFTKKGVVCKYCLLFFKLLSLHLCYQSYVSILIQFTAVLLDRHVLILSSCLGLVAEAYRPNKTNKRAPRLAVHDGITCSLVYTPIQARRSHGLPRLAFLGACGLILSFRKRQVRPGLAIASSGHIWRFRNERVNAVVSTRLRTYYFDRLVEGAFFGLRFVFTMFNQKERKKK